MRSIRTIIYSSHFARAAKKLPRDLREGVAAREVIFRHDCFDARLKTHKLKGRHNDKWSFSVTHAHRIVFRFLADDTAYFIDVGDHSIYQ